MTLPPATLYRGEVVHERLRPRRHRLSYRVFTLGLDVDRLDEAFAGLRLARVDRAGLVAVHHRDHGSGDGTPLSDVARAALATAGLGHAGRRIELVTYPRVLGYVFNPLSVFLCHDADDRLAAVVYEVTNTLGERTSYVLPAGLPSDGTYAHACAKAMYVSPFTPARLDYGFRVRRTTDTLAIGVNLRDGDGALLRAHFRGDATPLTDAALAWALAATPLMTFKVITAIHYEALRLFLKRVPVVRYTRSDRYRVVVAAPAADTP